MAQCKYTLKLHSSSCKSVTRQPPLLYRVSMRLNLTHLGDQLFDEYGMRVIVWLRVNTSSFVFFKILLDSSTLLTIRDTISLDRPLLESFGFSRSCGGMYLSFSPYHSFPVGLQSLTLYHDLSILSPYSNLVYHPA